MVCSLEEAWPYKGRYCARRLEVALALFPRGVPHVPLPRCRFLVSLRPDPFRFILGDGTLSLTLNTEHEVLLQLPGTFHRHLFGPPCS